MTKEIESAVLEIAAKIERVKLLNELMNVYEKADLSMPVEVYEFIQRKSK